MFQMYIRLLKMGAVKSVAASKKTELVVKSCLGNCWNTLVKPNTHNIITMKGHNTHRSKIYY